MCVIYSQEEMDRYLESVIISNDYPVVISKFITGAKEIEVDAVADKGSLKLWAISEHVEDAGVHSGDATLILPPKFIAFSKQLISSFPKAHIDQSKLTLLSFITFKNSGIFSG